MAVSTLGMLSGGFQSIMGSYGAYQQNKSALKNYEFNAELQGANYLQNQNKLDAYEKSIIEQVSLKRTQKQRESTINRGKFLTASAESGVTGRSVESRYKNTFLQEDLAIGSINKETENQLADVYTKGDESTSNYLQILDQLDFEYENNTVGTLDSIINSTSNFIGGYMGAGGSLSDFGSNDSDNTNIFGNSVSVPNTGMDLYGFGQSTQKVNYNNFSSNGFLNIK